MMLLMIKGVVRGVSMTLCKRWRSAEHSLSLRAGDLQQRDLLVHADVGHVDEAQRRAQHHVQPQGEVLVPLQGEETTREPSARECPISELGVPEIAE
jgi:hypothetical protein